MSKRKEAETSSDASQVYNPEFLHKFTPNSLAQCVETPNFKKQKTSLTMESEPSSNDLGADVVVQFFDAQLKGAPFFDFFAQEKIEDFVIQPKKPTLVDDSPVSYSDCGGPSNSGKSSECSKDVIETIPLRMYRPDCGRPNNSGESSECSEDVIEAITIRMYRPDSGMDWTVRKVLTASDCNAQCRLLIRKAVVEEHIFPHLDESSRALINSLDGLRVNVFDVDMGVELKLTLKKWPSSQYYGLMNNWKRDFVNRGEGLFREMKLGSVGINPIAGSCCLFYAN